MLVLHTTYYLTEICIHFLHHQINIKVVLTRDDVMESNNIRMLTEMKHIHYFAVSPFSVDFVRKCIMNSLNCHVFRSLNCMSRFGLETICTTDHPDHTCQTIP